MSASRVRLRATSLKASARPLCVKPSSSSATLRPGTWDVHQVSGRNRLEIARYEQYAHLVALDRAAKADAELAAALGSDYTITPDIVVVRDTEDDSAINAPAFLVDDNVTTLASLRKKNGGKPPCLYRPGNRGH